MKYLNLIRKIIKLPIAILFLPVWALIGFFLTNWESEDDVKYYKKSLKDLIW